MKKKIKDILDKYGIDILKYSYINSAVIIDSTNGKYVLKKKKRTDKKELYDYLLSRDFSFFLYPENDTLDDYEIYQYLSNIKTLKEEKAISLINIVSLLHNRTTTYKEYTLDEIKKIYESKNDDIDYLYGYYNELEEVFSNSVYPSPYELLFLNNVSKIYNCLNFSKSLVQEWYDLVINDKRKRIVFLHNHLSLDHFIDISDPKLINFDYSKYDSPIYDFVNFYKNHYYELDMVNLFNLYQHKYRFTDSELLLFFIEIIIPNKIKLSNITCNNTIVIHNLIDYIDTTRNFILKEKKKQKKEDYNEFNK